MANRSDPRFTKANGGPGPFVGVFFLAIAALCLTGVAIDEGDVISIACAVLMWLSAGLSFAAASRRQALRRR